MGFMGSGLLQALGWKLGNYHPKVPDFLSLRILDNWDSGNLSQTPPHRLETKGHLLVVSSICFKLISIFIKQGR